MKKRENTERMLELLGEMDVRYIAEADPARKKEATETERRGCGMRWLVPCAAGLLLFCLAGGFLRAVQAEDSPKEDETKLSVTQTIYRNATEKPAFLDVYVKRYEIEKLGAYYHPVDAQGTLCNNTYRKKAHETVYTEITVPERTLSDGSTVQYSRLNYFSSYRCTSCGYVYSEEELERIVSFETAEAGQ